MRRLAPLLGSALVLSLVAGGTGDAASELSNPGFGVSPRSIELTAELTDAGAIIEGNDVMVDGVKAGSVRRLRLVDGKAHVTFSVGGEFTPVHDDARVAIRTVSLLGERYVDLDRGSPSAPPLEDGALIPASRTDRAVQLQDVLDVVDDPTGTALAALIVAFGEGLAARGVDAAAAIDALEPALTETGRLLEILGAQNQLLSALIDRAEPVAAALGAERGARLDRLVGAAGDVLGAAASERPALEQALRRLPAALATARSALADLSVLAGETTPVLASLRPLTGDLRQIALELSEFADAAGPALASAEPVLERARELVAAATPVTAELRAAAGDVETTARATRTIVEALPEDAGNLLDFVRNAALALQGSDGLSHYLRIFVLGTGGAIGGLPAGPAAAPRGPGPRGEPAPGPATPERRGPVLSDLLEPVRRALPGRPAAEAEGSATGLTFDQERSLLDYLLGDTPGPGLLGGR